MTPARRTWLLFVIVASLIHTLRDILQFLAVDTTIATAAVKETSFARSFIWHPLNTVIIECAMLFLAIRALQRGEFGWEGKTTVFVAVATAIGFIYYWFFV